MTVNFAWAPLVHGRTAFVDFRADFIVSPDAFDSDQRSWAQRYVLAATRMADLRTRPLWCLFGNADFRVAGVVCNASDVSQEMYREEVSGRPLYVFLGYVQRQPGRGLPQMDLGNFAPLYSFVKDRWREKRHNSQHLVQAPFDLRPDLETAEVPGELVWNQSSSQVGLWPIEMEAELWQRAAGDSLSKTSFCFGVQGGRYAWDSPFRNVGAVDVLKPVVEKRSERAEPGAGRKDSEKPQPLSAFAGSPAREARIPSPSSSKTAAASGPDEDTPVAAPLLPSGFRSKPRSPSKPRQELAPDTVPGRQQESKDEDLEWTAPQSRAGCCILWQICLIVVGVAAVLYAGRALFGDAPEKNESAPADTPAKR